MGPRNTFYNLTPSLRRCTSPKTAFQRLQGYPSTPEPLLPVRAPPALPFHHRPLCHRQRVSLSLKSIQCLPDTRLCPLPCATRRLHLQLGAVSATMHFRPYAQTHGRTRVACARCTRFSLGGHDTLAPKDCTQYSHNTRFGRSSRTGQLRGCADEVLGSDGVKHHETAPFLPRWRGYLDRHRYHQHSALLRQTQGCGRTASNPWLALCRRRFPER